MTGRIIRDGTPVGAGVVLELESQALSTTTTTDADGRYAFELTSRQGDFSIVFAQAWNTHIYTDDQVASWAWLDGTALPGVPTIEVVDLEISLVVSSRKFEQIVPAAAATFPVGQISPASPLTFEWTPYPDATRYWVDLGREDETTPVWQSILTLSPSASFDGILDDETSITVGAYWWNIGAQKNIGTYQLTVYGHPRSLFIQADSAPIGGGTARLKGRQPAPSLEGGVREVVLAPLGRDQLVRARYEESVRDGEPAPGS